MLLLASEPMPEIAADVFRASFGPLDGRRDPEPAVAIIVQRTAEELDAIREGVAIVLARLLARCGSDAGNLPIADTVDWFCDTTLAPLAPPARVLLIREILTFVTRDQRPARHILAEGKGQLILDVAFAETIASLVRVFAVANSTSSAEVIAWVLGDTPWPVDAELIWRSRPAA